MLQSTRRLGIAQFLALATFMASSKFHPACAVDVAVSSRVTSLSSSELQTDSEYPGTAVERMMNARKRVKSLTENQLSGDWQDVRRLILWAGGLKDLPNSRPGEGYTGHSFNDFNHCDLTTMLDEETANENKGRVEHIAYGNQLGPGIKRASMPELGPGGSWSTCMIGCNKIPPQDVAHIQFRSRIAFKLVWCPPEYKSFVLVDDSGDLLNQGTPTGMLPDFNDRVDNYRLVQGSKYAVAADNRQN